jgi:DNA (cytosine-5)-methyltransferase 1
VTPSDIRRLIETIPMPRHEIAERLGCAESTIYRWKRGDTKPRLAELEMLRTMAVKKLEDGRPDFRFIDLFSGIGGLRRGVEAVGGRCVFSCERDKYSRKTYELNFQDGPEHHFAEDITAVEPESIPRHDLLLAGFPCQPFSIAGVSKKNALGRPQGNLFFNVADIIAAHRPAAFILENVKNLKSHDQGRTFARIRETLEETLGYQISTRIIDAKAYVPQHRERIFIVGFRGPVDFDLNKVELRSPTEGPRLESVLHSENGREEPDGRYTEGPNAAVVSKYHLTNHLWGYLRAYAEKHRLKGNGFGYGLVGPDDVARTLSARYYKDGSEILVRRGRKNPRRLTPRECARLMGFDGAGHTFKIGVSDTQAYKQFGNSVVVPVVTEVARAVIPHMLKLVAPEPRQVQDRGSVLPFEARLEP